MSQSQIPQEPEYQEVEPEIEIVRSPNKRNNNNNYINKGSRYSGKIKALDSLWIELRNARKSAESEANGNSNVANDAVNGGMVSCLPILREQASSSILGKGNGFRIDCTQIGPLQRKSHQRIISLKNLFSNTPKFQKNFNRGVYLTCLIYSEDKILVSLDDVLPSFQVEEEVGGLGQPDFYWFHKISSVWSDVKFLKQEMEKCDSASTLHFRLKLLQTVVTMQDSLDIRDLGKVFYKPIPTENGNVQFICTVNHLRSTKLISAPNVRWIPMEKFRGKKAINDATQMMSNVVQSLMLYYQMSSIPLGKGLYLGYFKLVTSVDQLKLYVPEKTPSILPNVKVRNNPHVTKDEWEVLTKPGKLGSRDDITAPSLTESQQAFRQQLDSSLKKLVSNLKIERGLALCHRLYTSEVIEVSSSVTLIVVIPAVENACNIEGDEVDLKWMESNKLMALPVQVFEMVHMLAYHNTLARRLMRLGSTLEVETILAQHNRRKAFSNEEMSSTQSQLETLTKLQGKLDQTWKECRWIMDVVKAARAKDLTFPSIRDFLNHYNNLQRKGQSSPASRASSGSGKGQGSGSPAKKILKGTYVNGNFSGTKQAPLTRLQLQQLLNLRRIQQTSPNKTFQIELSPDDGDILIKNLPLPGPCIPSNPNFKTESCSSLPIVGKVSNRNYDKLRSSASLFDFDVKGGSPLRNRNRSGNSLRSIGNAPGSPAMNLNLLQCTEEFIRLGLHLETAEEPDHLHHYQNVQELSHSEAEDSFLLNRSRSRSRDLGLEEEEDESAGESEPQYQNAKVDPSSSCYVMNQSSRSKLVSISTMKGRFTRDPGGKNYNLHGERVPGASPEGLTALSFTRQRTSLDRSWTSDYFPNRNESLSSSSLCHSSSGTLHEETSEGEDVRNLSAFSIPNSANVKRIVDVYAAYETGFSDFGAGTCIRLQISWETSSRQIIHSLISKLREKAGEKGRASFVEDFCLVSVIGARERVLRMDYKPLRLQKPWDTARLFVRKKDDVTAAVTLEGKLVSNLSER